MVATDYRGNHYPRSSDALPIIQTIVCDPTVQHQTQTGPSLQFWPQGTPHQQHQGTAASAAKGSPDALEGLGMSGECGNGPKTQYM